MLMLAGKIFGCGFCMYVKYVGSHTFYIAVSFRMFDNLVGVFWSKSQVHGVLLLVYSFSAVLDLR